MAFTPALVMAARLFNIYIHSYHQLGDNAPMPLVYRPRAPVMVFSFFLAVMYVLYFLGRHENIDGAQPLQGEAFRKAQKD